MPKVVWILRNNDSIKMCNDSIILLIQKHFCQGLDE